MLFPFHSLAMEWKASQLVDLSHSYNSQTIYWPTENGFALEKEFAGVTAKGYWYAANRFCTPEHGGTHMDAPLHFAEGQASVDQVPLEQLVGNGIVVDISASAKQNPDYQVQVGDLKAWEKRNGRIPDGTLVIFRTGYFRYWPDRGRYLGTTETGAEAVKHLRFPGLSPEAAHWLITERSVKAVGIDTASIDFGGSTHFETHRGLFAKGVPAFENLANLEKLPEKGFTLIALPMKIEGGSGAPLRVMAILN